MALSFERDGQGRGAVAGIRRPAGRSALVRRACIETLEDRRMLNGAPVLADIEAVKNLKFPVNKPVIVPLSSTDVDGDALRYTVSSSNPNIKVSLLKGNPYVKMTVSHTAANTGDVTIDKGVMIFQLFSNFTPRTVEIFKGLVAGEYYNGLKFHRLANLRSSTATEANIIQGGDQAGTGSGSAPFQFEDEFNAKTMFTGRGQLAMANSGADTNGTQFFITTEPQRHLDFKHTIFGQLVSGWDTLDKLANVKRSQDKPLSDVKIDKIELVKDRTDAALLVTPQAASGDRFPAGNVTVTVDDGHGNTAKKSFQVAASGDNKTNSRPVLLPIDDRISGTNQLINVKLNYLDWDKDRVVFSGAFDGENHGIIQVNGDLLQIYPEVGYKGPMKIKATIQPMDYSQSDTEVFVIGVGDTAIESARGLKVAAVSGKSAEYRVATFRHPGADLKAADYTAQINWGDGQVSNGTVKDDGQGGFIVSGTNAFKSEGSFPVRVNLTSKLGASAKIDTRAVVADAPLTVTPTKFNGTAPQTFSDQTLVTFKDTDSRGQIDDWTAMVDWGDGTARTAGSISTDSAGYKVSGTHTYGTAGNYNVVVTIRDKGGRITRSTALARVGRSTLTVDLTSNGAVDEAQEWTGSGSLTDTATPAASPYTAKVDYGDGSGLADLPLSGSSFTLKHTYADSGTFKVTVLVTDKNGITSNKTLDVTINNVAPTIESLTGESSGVRAQTRTINFTATDVSKGDRTTGMTWSVDWGDGTSVQSVAAKSTSATHVFTKTGTFTIKATAIDKDQGRSVEQTLTMTITAAGVQVDPDNPARLNLIVGGTDDADTITIDPAESGQVRVKIGTELDQLFAPSANGQIFVYGGAGNDKIIMGETLKRAVEARGGAGNDTITGGASSDILMGEAGDDVLNGRDGNDILLGGSDNDRILGAGGRDMIVGAAAGSEAGKGDTLGGGAGDDLIVGSSISFESDLAKLRSVMSEWVRTDRTYTQRVASILGPTNTGRNGKNHFSTSTVWNDYSVDNIRGDSGNDLYYASPNSMWGGKDVITGKAEAERLIEL